MCTGGTGPELDNQRHRPFLHEGEAAMALGSREGHGSVQGPSAPLPHPRTLVIAGQALGEQGLAPGFGPRA